MPFKPGESGNAAGRIPGTPNKITKTVKETVLAVFNDLQSDPETDLKAFAKKFPKDFHAIAAKLIPTEVTGALSVDVKWEVTKEYDSPEQKADTSS